VTVAFKSFSMQLLQPKNKDLQYLLFPHFVVNFVGESFVVVSRSMRRFCRLQPRREAPACFSFTAQVPDAEKRDFLCDFLLKGQTRSSRRLCVVVRKVIYYVETSPPLILA